MGKNTPRANKRVKKDDSPSEITPATSAKRSKRRNSHDKQAAYRLQKQDAQREKRVKQGGSLPEEVAPNTGVLTREGADVGDNDEDDDDDDDL